MRGRGVGNDASINDPLDGVASRLCTLHTYCCGKPTTVYNLCCDDVASSHRIYMIIYFKNELACVKCATLAQNRQNINPVSALNLNMAAHAVQEHTATNIYSSDTKKY